MCLKGRPVIPSCSLHCLAPLVRPRSVAASVKPGYYSSHCPNFRIPLSPWRRSRTGGAAEWVCIGPELNRRAPVRRLLLAGAVAVLDSGPSNVEISEMAGAVAISGWGVVSWKPVYRSLKLKGWFRHQPICSPRSCAQGGTSWATAATNGGQWMSLISLRARRLGAACGRIDYNDREVIGYRRALHSRAMEAERVVVAACITPLGMLCLMGAPVIRSDKG